MLQSGGQNSIIIVGGANMGANRNARIVLLQREIPDYVNIQVAKRKCYMVISNASTQLDLMQLVIQFHFHKPFNLALLMHPKFPQVILGCEGGSGQTRKQRIWPICGRGGTY
ncbi:hypothetical protein Sjap_018024 [Stephania japonica]|uniref:Uncharacterized protein n=1 Tax=Stephania japonica TaxID=461633 RepID=A0AAP0I787_9MAGN